MSNYLAKISICHLKDDIAKYRGIFTDLGIRDEILVTLLFLYLVCFNVLIILAFGFLSRFFLRRFDAGKYVFIF